MAKKKKKKNPAKRLYKALKSSPIKKEVRRLNRKIKASPFHKGIKSFENSVNALSDTSFGKVMNKSLFSTPLSDIKFGKPLEFELYGGKTLAGYLAMKVDDFIANRREEKRWKAVQERGKESEKGQETLTRISKINKLIKENPESNAVLTLKSYVDKLGLLTNGGNISKGEDALLSKKLEKALDDFEKHFENETLNGGHGFESKVEKDFQTLLADFLNPSEEQIYIYSYDSPDEYISKILEYLDEYEVFDENSDQYNGSYKQKFVDWLKRRFNNISKKERIAMRSKWKSKGFESDY